MCIALTVSTAKAFTVSTAKALTVSTAKAFTVSTAKAFTVSTAKWLSWPWPLLLIYDPYIVCTYFLYSLAHVIVL